LTVLFKNLLDIYSIGKNKGNVPAEFISEIVTKGFRESILLFENDLVYFSVHTSNSIKDMMDWTFKELKGRSIIINRALKQKFRNSGG